MGAACHLAHPIPHPASDPTLPQRVLKNDFMKFTRDADHEAGEELDETGWKYLHGDVFRWGRAG
jgi:hypothetical protein